MKNYQQRFSVPCEYPVLFDHDVFDAGREVLQVLFKPQEKHPTRLLVFVDSGVAEALPDYLEKVTGWLDHTPGIDCPLPPRIVTGGEAVKNDYRLTMEMLDTMLECRLCRHSYVLVIGGGAVLDAVGFAASIAHRGLRLVRFPSTSLAQNDAGIGVKNGMNLHGGKNTIGTFAPPHAVINDYTLLAGLDEAGWRDGFSEAVKVALLKDADFFTFLSNHAIAVPFRDQPFMEKVIERCAELHLDHIATSGDPFEKGSARPLDFGHWSAHKLERLSQYRITHGSAVATGIALDVCYGAEAGFHDARLRDQVIQTFAQAGFPLWHKEMEERDAQGRRTLFEGLEEFREHLGGALTLAMLKGPGNSFSVNEIDYTLLETACCRLETSAKSLSKP